MIQSFKSILSSLAARQILPQRVAGQVHNSQYNYGSNLSIFSEVRAARVLIEGPKCCGKTALLRAIDYVEAVISADVSRVDGVNKNLNQVRALMRSLSRNISTLASNETIRADIAMSDKDERTFFIWNGISPTANPTQRTSGNRLMQTSQNRGIQG